MDGRDTFEYDIYGMYGVPEEYLAARRKKVEETQESLEEVEAKRQKLDYTLTPLPFAYHYGSNQQQQQQLQQQPYMRMPASYHSFASYLQPQPAFIPMTIPSVVPQTGAPLVMPPPGIALLPPPHGMAMAPVLPMGMPMPLMQQPANLLVAPATANTTIQQQKPAQQQPAAQQQEAPKADKESDENAATDDNDDAQAQLLYSNEDKSVEELRAQAKYEKQ